MISPYVTHRNNRKENVFPFLLFLDCAFHRLLTNSKAPSKTALLSNLLQSFGALRQKTIQNETLDSAKQKHAIECFVERFNFALREFSKEKEKILGIEALLAVRVTSTQPNTREIANDKCYKHFPGVVRFVRSFIPVPLTDFKNHTSTLMTRSSFCWCCPPPKKKLPSGVIKDRGYPG